MRGFFRSLSSDVRRGVIFSIASIIIAISVCMFVLLTVIDIIVKLAG